MSGGIWHGGYCPAGICPGGICPGVFALIPLIYLKQYTGPLKCLPLGCRTPPQLHAGGV